MVGMGGWSGGDGGDSRLVRGGLMTGHRPPIRTPVVTNNRTMPQSELDMCTHLHRAERYLHVDTIRSQCIRSKSHFRNNNHSQFDNR
jgi:hypothetical protein